MSAKRLPLVCCLILSFAGIAAAADTQVSGTVNLNGAPLESGRIVYYLENGELVGTAIIEGLYSFSKVNVPTGSFKVTISGEGVPAKYSQEDAAPLKVEVRSGRNTFSIDLAK